MRLYNTLTHKKEEFQPLEEGQVKLFVCGPTVYDLSHLGHAKTYIQFDLLTRVLRRLGYKVIYLQNITDIDDKIIARAQEKGVAWEELREHYETEYFNDMESLGNTAVTSFARATDYIDDIIRQVQALLAKKHAYIIDDGIYFEIATFPDYGKLSGRREIHADDALTRIDHSDQKRGWNDFCLWKFSKPDEPVWNAPFGKGRPGWHIEDTAITEHFFGPQYDIHGGAVDLIFPHHEAEISQMEAASGKVPFVKYWLHTGFLNIDSAKMSKSLGNFFTIRDVLKKGYDPLAIRLLMLQSHYRSQLNFSWQSLDSAQTALTNLRAFSDLSLQTLIKAPAIEIERAEREIMTALADDLNTPRALAVLNSFIDDLPAVSNPQALQPFLQFLDDVLGLSLSRPADINEPAKKLIKQREQARAAADFPLADKLRDQLGEQGIYINDTQYGSVWRRGV